MESILQKIKDIRNVKGFSYENMADELKISTSAYRKIENNDTKLTVERLFQISEILQTPVNKLLGEKLSNVFYQNNNESGTLIGNQNFENYYHQENRETTQKLVQTMEQEILHLKEELNFMREMIKAKM
jgi:transcriptional regulator with XRE-family HTH domain